MALPFLKKKDDSAGIAGTIIQQRKPDEQPEESEGYSLEDCAQDILSAIQANDAQMLADALREAFEKLESEPHEEGPSPHTYDAQNQEAAGEE